MNYFLPTLALLFALTACGDPTPPADDEAMADPAANLPGPATTDYQERYRPRIHFSPPSGWMNDPNGMVYHDGEYHLFYQHYPDSTVWGPMHWGHAVSKDMISWEHLPIALYPDSLGYIFSGSAVVDGDNTSGFGRDGIDPLVAIYTYHDMDMEKASFAAGKYDVGSRHQYQAIAYSLDKGRTFTKYAGNPVMPNVDNIYDWRDPKVSRHAPTGQWVMALAARDSIMFYGSPNLENWEYLSSFGAGIGSHDGVWECPDLIPMTNRTTGEKRFVLLVSTNPGGINGGSATMYFVGDFDGRTFTADDDFLAADPDERGIWLDYGRDNYAGVTFGNVPDADGRTLFMGWLGNWLYAQQVPTLGWRSAMTLPRELTLRGEGEGQRVFSTPVEELRSLRANAFNDLSAAPATAPTEIMLSFKLSPDFSGKAGLELTNEGGDRYRIGYDAATGQFFSDRTGGTYPFSDEFGKPSGVAPRNSTSDTLTLHLFLDVASAELFADDGATVVTELFFPEDVFTKMATFTDEGAEVIGATGFALRSIWE